MKCPHCGAPLGLEEERCAYCGSPNPHAQKHLEDMRSFRNQFEATKEVVEKRSSRFAGLAVPLTILGLAGLMFFAALVFAAVSNDIGRSMAIRETAAMSGRFRAQIEEALEREDYSLVAQIYSVNGLHNLTSSYGNSELADYAMIFRACQCLEEVYAFMGDRSGDEAFRLSPEWIDMNCESFAGYLFDLYTMQDRDWYDESCYTEEKLAVIRDIQEQASDLLITYGGFTREMIAEIPDESEGKLAGILKEHLMKEEP